MELIVATEFAEQELSLDLIVSVAVFDVVTADVRSTIWTAARSNVAQGGRFVLVIPRNDASILRRCSEENAFQDGFVFERNGIVTFFRNFKDVSELIAEGEAHGFSVETDLSRYRQVCIVFRR